LGRAGRAPLRARDELVGAYLALARAVLGERLRALVRVAPEVLAVAVPVLAVQPLVENAVQHGIELSGRSGLVQVSGEAEGPDCVIAVEDDGPGMDPERARSILAGQGGSGSLGLVNVDRRLRAVYGPACGLVVETAPGAGTKVTVRVPRFHSLEPGGGGGAMTGLLVLAVDDVAPALDEPRQLLTGSPDMASVETAADPIGALRLIRDRSFDAVFLDISMPGLDGLELGALLTRMAEPPLVVFVTAHAARRRGPTGSARWTTCSSRSPPTGWPPRSPGCGGRPRRDRTTRRPAWTRSP
jgi:CheY-like chemotaxis protein